MDFRGSIVMRKGSRLAAAAPYRDELAAWSNFDSPSRPGVLFRIFENCQQEYRPDRTAPSVYALLFLHRTARICSYRTDDVRRDITEEFLPPENLSYHPLPCDGRSAFNREREVL